MKKIQNLRGILLCALLLTVLCLFCGCGAVVDTDMTIDDDFSGTRDILLTIESSDLTSYVTGGIEGLKTVITQSIPDEMTYDISTAETGAAVIKFQIAFTDLEDYKTKVAAILAAGESTVVPEVKYERKDNPFKQGVVFSENFDSIDLMLWYQNALKTANIISETSTSNWYERGKGTVTIGDKEFEENYDIDISEMEYNTLESIAVTTTVALDGSMVRELRMTVLERTYETLKENGCNLDSYLSALVSEGDTIVREDNGDQYNSRLTYVATLHAADVAELETKTDKLLQTQGNSFEWSVAVKEDAPGYGIISVKEKLDGSYYVPSSYYTVSSTVKIFENVKLNPSENAIYSTEGGFYYDSSSGEEIQAELTWKIGFETVELDVDPYGKENVKVTMKFTVNSQLNEEIRASAFASIEDYAADLDVEKEDNVLTVSVKGKMDDVAEILNKFAKGPTVADWDFVTMEMGEASTLSPFTKGKTLEITYNFSELIGENAKIILNTDKNMYLDGVEKEDDTVFAESEGTISLYQSSVKVFPILLAIFFGLLICGGLAVGVLARKELFALIGWVKNLKIQKPAKQAAVATAPAAVSAPATVPAQEEKEEDDDEEVLL